MSLPPLHINDEVFMRLVVNDPSIKPDYGDPNTWPLQHGDADPSIAARPEWRYPNRPDFFELGGPSRIDWPSREIDHMAKRADGLLIYVARSMTLWETIWYWPRLVHVRHYVENLPYRWREMRGTTL